MDAARRDLERAAARGDAAARTALFASRLRAGELTRDRLRLIAALGDAGAAEAAGWTPSGDGWDHALRVLGGQEGLGRAQAALGRWIVEVAGAVDECLSCRGQPPPHGCFRCDSTGHGAPILQQLEAYERWVLCPCPAHAAASPAPPSSGPLVPDERGLSEQWTDLLHLADWVESPATPFGVVSAELLPWATGERDPLRERVGVV